MYNVNWRDVLARTVKTAVAVFVSAIPVQAVINADINVIKAGAFAAAASVVTAIWNFLLQWSQS